MPKDTIFSLIKNLKDGKSLEIKEKMQRIADFSTNLLIFGETGVGKDFWVDYLFEVSKYEKMVNLNCGDVPEHLLESEWFGYKKGAFTGADRDYEGRWKRAHQGILFLNQVDLLSLNLQSKLLRIIERKKYFPLGSNREIDIDVRFIFSADADIEHKVRQGEFRQDLYYRMSSYSVFIPALRDRKKDILPLINFFAGGKQLAVDLSKKAVRMLLDYPWRGNIREVENFVTNISIVKQELRDEDVYGLLKTAGDFLEAVKTTEMSLAGLEWAYIEYLLRKYKKKSVVAKILDISRKSLYDRIKRHTPPAGSRGSAAKVSV
ncbi:MAG: sigma-54-dependent Fis family transcriptional regulator [Candidatus Aminicenantes bacterium]|nr:sigma-54-dependent Fis family transcriptional regulator [Candidatus Aminicenantes bacterium]